MDDNNPYQLALIAAKPTSLSDLQVSTPLWRLLSSSLPSDGEVAEICGDPVLHTEVKFIAARLSMLAKPCGEEAVRLALQPLILVYGVSQGANTAAFWKVYFKQLSDLPAEALAKAVDDYAGLPDAEFFPKPGPLRALALKHAEPICRAAYRARRAADSMPRKQGERVDPAKIRELAAQLSGRLTKRW